jgi:uncharacterized membrane protein YhaH (DUF805 family)
MAADKSPIAWAITPLKRYAEFSGRSSRAEFWWFMLAMLVCWLAIWFLLVGSLSVSSMAVSEGEAPSAGAFGAIGGGMIFMGLFWLALIIPTISVGVRRLHDSNRSGWWLGAFYLLYAVYIVMLFGSMAGAMSAAMSGGTEPPAPNMGMLAGTGILGLVIFIYAIVLLVFYCLPGTKGDNRFGPDPYGADVEKVFA